MAFDPENRLTSVTTPWEEEMSAAYNGDNQRVQKTDDEEGSYNLYLYDGGQMVEETYGTGSPWAYHTYGPAGLVSSNFGGTTTFFAFDPQGNVSERMNSSGSVTSYDVYDAYGDYATTDTAYTNQNFGAQWGYFYDYETGLLLTGQRYRPAGHDEFVTRDPSGYDGGINLYDYTGNNPVNEIDPDGTSAVPFSLGAAFVFVRTAAAAGLSDLAAAAAPAALAITYVGAVGGASYAAYKYLGEPLADSLYGTWTYRDLPPLASLASGPKCPADVGLPTTGRFPFIPPKRWLPGNPLYKRDKGGYEDNRGNIWKRGSNHHFPNDPFEWDVSGPDVDGDHMNVGSQNGGEPGEVKGPVQPK